MRGVTKHLLIILLVFVSLGEISARLFFKSPYISIKPRPKIPYYQSSINLGWVNNSGNYTIDFLDGEDARTIRITIGKNGERLSYPNSRLNGKSDVLFVGDSWTFGEAVQGEEAFPGIVAKAIPKNTVVNLGVGGYSTYQTLLQLESLDWRTIQPRNIFYGFLSFHEERNIASNGWKRSLSRSSQGRDARLPFVRIHSGSDLVRQLPVSISIPGSLTSYSYLLSAGLHGLWRAQDELASDQKRKVTELLLLEMRDLVERQGAEFSVILMDPASFRYESYLAANRINYIEIDGKFGRLPYDAHPDLNFHTLAAHRILENVSASVLK